MLTAYLPAVKVVTQIVASVGAAKIVGEIIKNNVNIVTTLDKILVGTGSFALGSMVGTAVGKHVVETIDEIVTITQKNAPAKVVDETKGQFD